MRSIVHSDQAPAPIGPYSQAVQAGGMLFISGQVAIDPVTGEVPADISLEEETEMVMDHLAHIAKAAGSDLRQAVKCSIFLSDMGHFARVNAVYGSRFPQDPPARETVEVSRLPKDVRVEISAILAL